MFEIFFKYFNCTIKGLLSIIYLIILIKEYTKNIDVNRVTKTVGVRNSVSVVN